MEYEIVTARDFRANQRSYLDMADTGKNIFIKRRGGKYYRLGVPLKLPDFTKKPVLCEHKKEAGMCLIQWCDNNPNNRHK